MEEKELKKCQYCGREMMRPVVDHEAYGLLIGLECNNCGSVGPKMMFDISMIDEKKFMEKYINWLEKLC